MHVELLAPRPAPSVGLNFIVYAPAKGQVIRQLSIRVRRVELGVGNAIVQLAVWQVLPSLHAKAARKLASLPLLAALLAILLF